MARRNDRRDSIRVGVVELSPATKERLLALFRPEQAAEAERLLEEDCAEALPLVGEPATSSSLERIRFAALRTSGGDLDALRDAIRVARTDWRDLLVGAGFGHDPGAHTRWQPRRFDGRAIERWRAGDRPSGVEFQLHESVDVVVGRAHSKRGVVVALVGLEPEPRYRVQFPSGEETPVFQAILRRAG